MARPTTTTTVLQRVLAEPDLVPAVQGLDPMHFDALVRTVGLEDAGELLAMATADQVVHLVDASLWRRNGTDETFDHARFVTWLEVIGEGGDAAVARRLRELPVETLVLAFSGQLLVIDRDTLGIGMAGASAHEAELAERALDACLYLELDDYTLVARRSLGWDAVISALLALDRIDHDLVARVLADCCAASTEVIDDGGGLYEVLTAAEMVEEDARADRDDRRARGGWVRPADAQAFLHLPDPSPPQKPPARDPVTAAYFRELDASAQRRAHAPSRLSDLLDDLGVVPSAGPAALPSPEARRMREALAALPDDVRATRQAELAYLANVLLAAGHTDGPLDAAQQALDVCGRGLAHLDDPHDALRTIGCDQLFRLGRTVRLFVGARF